ncbi:hypothetical protein BBJ28_00011369 [Nothophytophthora sp. Chile5]|nr:hypothetical protein BBJ28_00011369 [Nothophytophthora sp. Chile5]
MGKLASSLNVKVMELTGEKDYEDWKLDLHLKTAPFGFRDMIYGLELLDEARAETNKNYLRCWNERKVKGFTMLATSLSTKMRRLFRQEVSHDDPAALYAAILANFERGKGNTIFLKHELYGHRMKKGETVQKYVDGLEEIRRRMTDNGETVSNDEMARIVLSNCVVVYPEVTKTYTSWAKNNREAPADLRQAIDTVETAEQSDREIASRSGSPGSGQGLQQKVNALHLKQQHRGHRSSSVKSKQSRSDWVAERQRNDKCANCGEVGHWYYRCPDALKPDLQRKKDKYEADHARKKGKHGEPRNIVNSVMIASRDRVVQVAEDEEEKSSSPIRAAPTDPHSQYGPPCDRVSDRMPIRPMKRADVWKGVMPPPDWRVPQDKLNDYEFACAHVPPHEREAVFRDTYLMTQSFPLDAVDNILGATAARRVWDSLYDPVRYREMTDAEQRDADVGSITPPTPDRDEISLTWQELEEKRIAAERNEQLKSHQDDGRGAERQRHLFDKPEREQFQACAETQAGAVI